MGLKKYDKEQEILEQEALKAEEKEEKSKLEQIISENSLEEEELRNLPLDERQKAVTDRIETSRLDYANFTKKQKKLNTAISVSVLVVLVACVILIFALGKAADYVSYICLGVMIAVLIGTFFSTKVIKNKMSLKAEEYIAVLYRAVNEYLYAGEDFKNLAVKPQGQMKDELFIDARFYKNIKSTKSRNLVSVEYKGKILGSADLAGNILIKNRLSPMFLGKYFDYTSKYDKEGKRIVMQIKGDKLSRPIDDVEDLTLVEGNDTYAIYSNDTEWRKILTQKVIKDITQLKIDKTLIDVLISIRPGKLNIGIDYVDEFMNIPVEHNFDFNSVKRAEHDLKKVITILDDLN